MLIKKCLQYSMTNFERMWSLIQSFHHVKQESLIGDFVECGIWKGGNIILLKKLLQKFNVKKKFIALILSKAWRNLPPMTPIITRNLHR